MLRAADEQYSRAHDWMHSKVFGGCCIRKSQGAHVVRAAWLVPRLVCAGSGKNIALEPQRLQALVQSLCFRQSLGIQSGLASLLDFKFPLSGPKYSSGASGVVASNCISRITSVTLDFLTYVHIHCAALECSEATFLI